MKKNFRILLVALFAVLGFTNAWAALPAEIEYGGCTYTVTDQDATAKTAKVTLKSGVTVSAGAIQLPGNFNYTMGSDTYKVSVTQIDPVTLPLKNLTEAVSVTIPKEIEAIPENCFYGCTYLKTIVFEAGSAVKSIGTHAFATTQISEFDFSPCKSLAELPNEVFVEPGLKNTFITKVTVPSGDDAALFKHINGAFRNLTKLTNILGLNDSWIQEVIGSAFYGCEELKTLKLPGRGLRYIDEKALSGSVIETLSIDVNSLLNVGNGVVKTDYTWGATSGDKTNLYAQTEIKKTPLKSLTLTGTLKGTIDSYSFAWCDKLNSVLDFTGMTFGSTGNIATNAFLECYNPDATPNPTGILGVKIGDITDNTTTGYTIAEDAFKGCILLDAVEIRDITTAKAVGKEAFGKNLKTLTIGTVKSSGAVFQEDAFVFANVKGVTLNLATAPGKFLNSNDAATIIIPAGTFNLTACATADLPVIKIGEIRSKGGVFVAGSIKNADLKELTFTGAIADNGLNAPLLSADSKITEIKFMGSIGMGGIATGALSNQLKITTLTFEGLLAEGAVAKGAFAISNDGTSKYALKYTCTTVPDYTVNPFHVKAMNASAVDGDANRFIVLTVANENLGANFEDEVNGINGTATDPTKFDIYFVKLAEPEADPAKISFTLYRNDNATSEAWGRYDLGSFVKENKDGAYTQTSMIIPRVQKIKQSDDTEVTAKLTLYGIYTDEDDVNKEATIYMVPLHVINGKYEITKYNSKLIIAKAAISGSFVDKEIEWKYDNATTPTKNSVWTTIPGYAFAKQTAADNVTNQQLWDKTKNLFALFGSCAPDGTTARGDIWGTYTKKPMYDLYIMSNPVKNKGFRVDKNVVAKGGAYIAPTWYFALLKNYGDDAAPARVVWLDDSQATAIFGVKEVKTAESNDDAIYNLQGIRVSAPVKGQLYIQNGKKFIAK